MTKFEKDIIDLFLYKKGGHVQRWLYSDLKRPDGTTGAGLWHEFVTNNEDYYIIRRETELIPDLISHLDDDFDTIVDFGIGNTMAINNKTLPIINSQKVLKRYIAIDQSANELQCGLQEISDKADIKTIGIHDDFYNVHATEGNKKLGLCLGSTITNQEMRVGDNVPLIETAERIATLCKTVEGSRRGSLILSIDANPDIEAAKKLYDHPAWYKMNTGLMHDVKTLLKPEGNFNPYAWEFKPVIDRKNYVFQTTISPSEDQSFAINGQEFNVCKEDQFVTINLFKFPLEMIVYLIKESGFTLGKEPIFSSYHPIIMLETETVAKSQTIDGYEADVKAA